MKNLIYLFVLAFAFSCNNKTENDDCIDASKIDPDAACVQVYEPVCGCNGKTYGNSCEAEAAGVTEWTEGECEEDQSS